MAKKYTADNIVLDTGIYLGGTASANLLDDYEEGTWTPKFWYANSSTDKRYFQQGDAEIDYWSNNCKYTKIGNVVHCHVNLGFSLTTAAASALNTNGSFNMSTSGLPFSVSSRYFLGGVVYWRNAATGSSSRNLTGAAAGQYHFAEIVGFMAMDTDGTTGELARAKVGEFSNLAALAFINGRFSYTTT